MIVVSDTSVVTSLIQIGRIELLFEIFGGVMIPEAVAEELSVSHVLLPPWIQIQGVRDRQVLGELCAELDLGESEAIALAVELSAEFLLMDEKRGRAVAQRAGLVPIGILGVATAAKRLGLLDSITTLIRELREQASFWISAELEARVLRDAGEGGDGES
jgi:predicted nucleic acid-binding protein